LKVLGRKLEGISGEEIKEVRAIIASEKNKKTTDLDLENHRLIALLPSQ